MTKLFLGFMCAAALLAGAVAYAQVDSSARESLERQLEALEREAVELDGKISSAQQEARTLEREVKLLENEIRRRDLEIKRLTIAVRQAEMDIQAKASDIEVLTGRITKNRQALSQGVQRLYEYDQEHILVVLARN